MLIRNKCLSTEVPYSLGEAISQHCIQREALYLSLVGTTRRLSTLLAKSMISKMTLGAELRISMLQEILLLAVSSTINTSMCSLEGQSLTKKKSQILLRCTISISTCGASSTCMPSLLGQLVTQLWLCLLIVRPSSFLEALIKQFAHKSAFSSMLRIT